MDLPVNIQRAFICRASGGSWIQCAEVGETTTENLRKWRNHPDAAGYIQTAIESNLGEVILNLLMLHPRLQSD